MFRLNKDISKEKEMELVKKLYENMSYKEVDIEDAYNDDMSDGCLTCNIWKTEDGKKIVVFHYLDIYSDSDDCPSLAIDMEGNIYDAEYRGDNDEPILVKR